jgi:hypothetical protein
VGTSCQWLCPNRGAQPHAPAFGQWPPPPCPQPRLHHRRWLPPPLVAIRGGHCRGALPFSFYTPPRRIASASHSHPASTPRAMLTPTTAPVTRAPPVSTFSSSLSWCPVREARQLIWRTRELPAARSVHHRAPR